MVDLIYIVRQVFLVNFWRTVRLIWINQQPHPLIHPDRQEIRRP